MKTEDVCHNIENYGFYKDFIQNIEEKSSNLKESEHVSQQIERLSYGLELISAELQNNIREQHDALLTQASHSGQLDNALETVKLHVNSIQHSANKIKKQIAGPYANLESQTRILRNLHITFRFLQRISWFLKMYRELQDSNDPAKQAQILSELEPIGEDTNITKLDVVKQECRAIIQFRHKLLTGATQDLQEGLKNYNLHQIQASLQIFSNLNLLDSVLKTVFENLYSDAEYKIRLALESGLNLLPSSAQMTTGDMKDKVQASTNQLYKVKLWAAIDKLFCEELYNPCQQVQLLERLINDENIFVTNKNLLETFWEILHTLLMSGFKKSSSRAWHSLELELPRLLGAASSLEGKLGRRYNFKSELFQPFENGYIKRCQTNLQACFLNIIVPSCDTVDNLIRTSTTELSAAIVNKNLSGRIVMLVNNANSSFWDIIEAATKKSPEAAQIVDSPNAMQLTNISLANIVHYHGEQIRSLVYNLGTNLPEPEADRLLADLSKGDQLICRIVQPLKKSIDGCICAILISLHQDPSLNNSMNSSGPSLYMKELQQFIARVKKTHLAPYNDLKVIAKCCNELATHCIDQFIFNVSCVRPLTTAGRKKLIIDCGHLETALKPFINDLAQLGSLYKSLRALSVVLDLPPQSVTIDETLRASTVLMLLFSYAGQDLISPHAALNWNIEKLSLWWDCHTSEQDRLEIIAGALQKYDTIVRQKKSTHYDPIYSVISRLLKTVKS